MTETLEYKTELNSAEVTVKWFDYTSVRIDYEGGYLSASLGKLGDPANFYIEYTRVPADKGRQGIGRTLLRLALQVAAEQQAAKVTAYITSRECLENMRMVFGEESLEVMREGEYQTPELPYVMNRPRTTMAALDYPIPPGLLKAS